MQLDSCQVFHTNDCCNDVSSTVHDPRQRKATEKKVKKTGSMGTFCRALPHWRACISPHWHTQVFKSEKVCSEYSLALWGFGEAYVSVLSTTSLVRKLVIVFWCVCVCVLLTKNE